MRAVGSSRVDPFSATAAATAALYGPLLVALTRPCSICSSRSEIRTGYPQFVDRVKNGDGLLMGFGHRVYKSYDPRAKIIKEMAHQVLGVTGGSPLLDVALELERIALEDDYFIERRLYPNVDFYSASYTRPSTSPWICSQYCSPSHAQLLAGPVERDDPRP